ncbi:MAG: 2-C-methyl-D-erythritol 4-phosphate cytidylyltransferase [Bacillota bacterium]
MCRVAAIIAAAGRGQRMGYELNKQYLHLAGRPVLAHSLDVFELCPSVSEILLVVGKDDLEYCRQKVILPGKYTKIQKLITGGDERQDSVYNGLVQVSQPCSLVVVHDGARPLLTLDVLERVIDAAAKKGAAIAAMPVKDTIKVGNESGVVLDTPERGSLWSVQTPQAFAKELLLEAYENARKEHRAATDDASLVEYLGHPVQLVKGSYDILKRREQDAGRARL